MTTIINFVHAVLEKIAEKEQDIAPIALLFLFGFAGFALSLYNIPSLGDDVYIFSSVCRTPNPLVYFVGDWGAGTQLYRPLLSLSFWLCYKLFGLNAFVNQGMSIATHLLMAILVYKIIRLYQKDVIFSFLIASLALYSFYIAMTVPMATDRCTIFAAVFILLLFHHLVASEQANKPPRLAYVVLLSILAIMSKESGLIAPMIGFVAYLKRVPRDRRAWWGAIALVALCVGYIGFRLVIFHDSSFAYGVDEHGNASSKVSAPLLTNATVFLSATVRNFLAPFFPFHGMESLPTILKRAPILIVTVALWGILLRPPFTYGQRLAFWFILFSALVHPVYFFRLIFLGHVAFCLLLGCSQSVDSIGLRKTAAKVVAFILLSYSVYTTTTGMKNAFIARYQMMYRDGLTNITEDPNQERIDQRIVDELRARYPF